MTKYRALVGFNYPNPKGAGEVRVEAGEVAEDLPDPVVKTLLAQGAIENVGKAEAKRATSSTSSAGGED